MGTPPAEATGAAVSVQRARRSDLGPIFALIRRARGGRLSEQDIVKKAIGYGYLKAELNERLIGVAGMLVENSIACVRDLHPVSRSMLGLATVALMDAVEAEAGGLACEAVIVQVPPGSSLIEALLRDRRYAPRALSAMRSAWREVATEQFEVNMPLWVNNLRELR
jgi:hypothetical protein